MKCFYHNDLDGKCAGHIVASKLGCTMEENEDDFIEITYGKDFPLWVVQPNEEVYIVDYSIEPEEMEKLLDVTPKIYWIDHHKTAIEKYEEYENRLPIDGIRKIGTAGCCLTWEFLFGGEIPMPIQYIGDRDVWAWKYGNETKFFCNGCGLLDLHPLSQDWEKVFLDPDEILKNGAVVESYKSQRQKEYLEAFGHVVEFEGDKAWCVNAGMVGKDVFDSLDPDYKTPLYIMYVHDGEKYAVSLRSDSVDVFEIAKKYGGGGHTGAAGFQCQKLPWTNKISPERLEEIRRQIINILDESLDIDWKNITSQMDKEAETEEDKKFFVDQRSDMVQRRVQLRNEIISILDDLK